MFLYFPSAKHFLVVGGKVNTQQKVQTVTRGTSDIQYAVYDLLRVFISEGFCLGRIWEVFFWSEFVIFTSIYLYHFEF